MINLLLAASFTFTALSTGLEKGAPVEFYWVDKNSDRDYEALFILENLTQPQFRKEIEKAGLKRGKAVEVTNCIVWPVGNTVKITPQLEDYVDIQLPDGYKSAPPIYTGGFDGTSIFALYSQNESPIVFNGDYPQGNVYNSYKVKKTLKKGTRVQFTIAWNDADRPESLSYELNATNLTSVLKELRAKSEKSELDVQVNLASDLTVRQAQAIAQAMDLLDSPRLKFNGVKDGGIFYRAFLPKIAWLTRTDRLVQPFELTLKDSDLDELIFIDEDWTVEGDDPKLTLKPISFAEAKQKEKTNTCFIFASPETKLIRIEASMQKLKGSKVTNWYVFERK